MFAALYCADVSLITFEESLAVAVRTGHIERSEALLKAQHPEELASLLPE